LSLYPFSLSCSAPPPHLPSFPTRRSSDLTGLFGGMVWFLAIFGGALADRLGFRRSLGLAYLILTFAYFSLGSIGAPWLAPVRNADRKSTRLNSSHVSISYAVFCLKKKNRI